MSQNDVVLALFFFVIKKKKKTVIKKNIHFFFLFSLSSGLSHFLILYLFVSQCRCARPHRHRQPPPLHLSLRHSLHQNLKNPKSHTLSCTPRTINLSTKCHSFLPLQNDDVFELEEELVIGDCVVFEERIFDDPYLQNDIKEEPQTPKPNKKQNKPISEIEPENLVPKKWKEVQVEINIMKRERRKIS